MIDVYFNGTISDLATRRDEFASILAGALILAPPRGSVWTMTIGSAVVIWLGFVVPSLAASYRMRALPGRTAIVDCGYWLVVMLAQAVVLRVIGLMPPPV